MLPFAQESDKSICMNNYVEQLDRILISVGRTAYINLFLFSVGFSSNIIAVSGKFAAGFFVSTSQFIVGIQRGY